MALDIWTIKSGYSFGQFEERTVINIPLPVSTSAGITFSVISGQLPPGLRIENDHIIGTPFTVPRLTKFTFCIRADNSTDVSDRTFSISINNTEIPVFITPAGELPLGPSQQLFALADTYIDFQIVVNDLSLVAGKKLTFFIADEDGILPPGLILTDSGRLVGFIQPVLSIKPEDGDGSYDTGPYDNVAFDFGYRSTNGYDSYIFDSVFYDFNAAINIPRQLNRNYEFIVSVTDGDNVVSRKFDIFVVGDDYFKADNNTLLDGSGLFTADATYLTAPVWSTPGNLGTIRANNYVLIPVTLYDTLNVICSKELVNADIIATTLQLLSTDNVLGGTHLTLYEASSTPIVGQYLTFDGLFFGATSTIHQIIAVQPMQDSKYRVTLDSILEATVPSGVRFTIGSLSQLPPGMEFDENDNVLYGYVPYQPAITASYKFTIVAIRRSGTTSELAKSWRVFTINVIGEIESAITWNTDPYLGDIAANYISTLKVQASSVISNGVVVYSLTSGQLPPGLSLNVDGEIIGKVNQFGTPTTAGITNFDFFLDNSTTTIDCDFVFTVTATILFGYGATSRTFTITVTTPSDVSYSNIKVKPYLKLDQRSKWNDFINNPNIFSPLSIYRSNDINFGIQKSLSMLIYAGIETVEAAKYISAIGLNHKKKRFNFNGIKKAIAYNPGTTDAVYEVVYMEMIDPLEPNGQHLPSKLTQLGKDPSPITVDEGLTMWNIIPSDIALNSVRPELMITIDRTGYISSDPNINTYYPSSITNWRQKLKSVGLSERNFLPLWMRSIQLGSKQQLDFQLAVPICYCKPGTADKIILNIKYSGFDFTLLDYTIDRYTIDAVEGSIADKYLVFRNDRITL